VTFHFTKKQMVATDIIGGDATHILLFGGSRSGKSFFAVRALFARAIYCPNSRHLIARFRLSHVKASVIADTIPKVIELCFPELKGSIQHLKSENHYKLPNGSEVWYAGLDDKDRTEKILGMEFATLDLEECSQIPWASRETLITRLAQKTSRPNPEDMDGKKGLPRLPGLRLKAYYTQNPPNKNHWTYKLFIERKSPDTSRPVPDPANYNFLKMNPDDNVENIADGYVETVLGGLSERQQRRFRYGEFGDLGEAALWSYELIDQQRIGETEEVDMSDFIRVVVAVDPSGASSVDDAHRDEIGIVAAGLRANGKVLVLEDATMKGSPGEWGKTVVQVFERWGADRVVGETNFGGDMVRFVVQSAAAEAQITVPYRAVFSSRGKYLRAEPIAALYEAAKVEHMPGLKALEDEMVLMTTSGYAGERSPNRVDAAVFAITDLFPTVIKKANAETSAQRHTTPQVNLGHSQAKRAGKRR